MDELTRLTLRVIELEKQLGGFLKVFTETNRTISDLDTRIRNQENQQLSKNMDILASDMKALKLLESKKWKVWQ